MNDHNVELVVRRVAQELFEDGSFSDRHAVGGLALFTVDLGKVPVPDLAQLREQALLGVQGVALDLREVGDPYVGYCPLCFRLGHPTASPAAGLLNGLGLVGPVPLHAAWQPWG